MYFYDGEHKESHILMVQKNIQEVVEELDCGWIDAVTTVCDRLKIDTEEIVEYLSPTIIDCIRLEAVANHMIREDDTFSLFD